MIDTPLPEPLDPPAATRLTNFAQACSAAAQAVSRYPAAHPSVVSALTRLSNTAVTLTETAPIRLTVLPDGLLFDGRAMASPNSAISELTRLLHQHQVGTVDVRDGGSSSTWLVILRLLTRPPEENRESGGIAHLWGKDGDLTTTEQRHSVEVREVDYEELLRHRPLVDPATLAEILESLESGRTSLLSAEARAALREIVSDPEKVELLIVEMKARADGDEEAHAQSVLHLLRAVYELFSDDGNADEAAWQNVLSCLATMLTGIADVYDAMRSQRAYQQAYPTDRILAVLKRNDGGQFDQHLVRRFVRLIGTYPPGTLVRLNTREMAVVLKVHAPDPHRPRVRILRDATGATISPQPIRHLWETVDDNEVHVIGPLYQDENEVDPLDHL